MSRVLLIDADIFCWRAATAAPEAEAGAPGQARARLDGLLALLRRRLDATSMILAASDAENFRRTLLPSYKAGRAGRSKPAALPALFEHLAATHDLRRAPGLEADDVLGVLATADAGADLGPIGRAPGPLDERVVVSPDKDLRTTPGLLSARLGRIERITPAAADRAHLSQTLTGDAADGYRGCPGVGPKTAAQFLDAPYRLVRAGQRWSRRRLGSEDDLWGAIVSLFERAGLDEAAALTQARVARILRAGDYDPCAGAPRLWRPCQIPAALHS